MSDITKAKFYLNRRNSKLQHLTSFGSMLATAEANYRDVRIQTRVGRVEEAGLATKEIESSVDYAVLRYLNKNNQLPANVSKLFRQGITLEEKTAFAKEWYNG